MAGWGHAGGRGGEGDGTDLFSGLEGSVSTLPMAGLGYRGGKGRSTRVQSPLLGVGGQRQRTADGWMGARRG